MSLGEGIGGLLGGVANLAGLAGEGSKRQRQLDKELWFGLETPELNPFELSPIELQMVAERYPEVYNAVIPDEVKLINDSPELRQAEIRGLNQIQRVADEGLPLNERLAALRQQDIMAQQSQRQQDNLAREFQMRGMGGGGAELAQRAIANQQAAQMARGMGDDLAMQAVNNRIGAAGQAAQMAGRIRGQDLNVQRGNADAQNRFNELVAQIRNQAGQYGAGARERAQQYNVAQRQGIADQNKQFQYATDLANRQRRNDVAQQDFNNRLAKLQGQSGAVQRYGRYKDAQTAAKADAIYGIGSGVGAIAGSMGGF